MTDTIPVGGGIPLDERSTRSYYMRTWPETWGDAELRWTVAYFPGPGDVMRFLNGEKVMMFEIGSPQLAQEAKVTHNGRMYVVWYREPAPAPAAKAD